MCEDRFAEIRLYIVECGECGFRLETFANALFGGYGETFWIRNGRAQKVASDFGPNDLPELRAITDGVFNVLEQ